jgi:hypothetical protein
MEIWFEIKKSILRQRCGLIRELEMELGNRNKDGGLEIEKGIEMEMKPEMEIEVEMEIGIEMEIEMKSMMEI